MKVRIVSAVLLVLATLLPAAGALAAPPPRVAVASHTAVAPHGPATAAGRGGAVATVETLATRAAVRTLRAGGTAVDAAVVAAGVLTVTEPFSCGIGGGGYLVIYDAARRKVVSIDGRETAPAAMTSRSFWEGGAPLSFSEARYSGLSVGVPATVATWEYLLRRYGTLSLREALAPAVAVAERGFVVDQTFHDQTAPNAAWFAEVPSTSALYLDPDGTPRDVGTVLRNPDLARTLRLIGREGAAAFYRGPLAEAIVQTVTRPPVAAGAVHAWRPGVMTAADLRSWRPVTGTPTRVRYRGLDVYGIAPSSSGGSTIGEALNVLSGYPLAGAARDEVVQKMLEASRYSFADRNAYVADPAYFRVPLAGLLDPAYAAERRSLIGDVAAVSPVAPGDPWPFTVPLPGVPTEAQRTSTTHISTWDRRGTIVSYTFTIESTGGSGLVVPGYGFLLNNELTDFTYDSVTAANRVQGGKRPRSSMAPTIVLRGRTPLFTVGSPGGSTIITTVLQLLVDRIDAGMTLPEAVADPRASQRNLPATDAEAAFQASSVAEALRTRGYTFAPPAEIGAATGIERLGDGRLLAAAEPVRRGGGSALVVRPAGAVPAGGAGR